MPERREFLTTPVVTPAISAALATDAADHNPVEPVILDAGSSDLHVHHEWGTLEEVIVGYPYMRPGGKLPRSVANFQRSTPEMTAFMQRWLDTAPMMPVEEFAPTLWAKQNDQMNAAIKILRDHGVRVHQVEKIDADELAFEQGIGPTCIQQFPRDPILVVGDRYFELPMHMPYRRKERFPIRRTLADRLAELRAPIVSAPEPLPSREDDAGSFGASAFLEGGDVMLFGKDIFVGNTGNASNSAGIDWLQAQLGSSYRVHEVLLSRNVLHLDCVLCTPRPGLAIVCRDAFINGIPDYFKGWELIEVSREDAETKLACNGLILDQKNIIIGTQTPEIADRLARAGINVYPTPFDTLAALGGAFRCWHHPLKRIS